MIPENEDNVLGYQMSPVVSALSPSKVTFVESNESIIKLLSDHVTSVNSHSKSFIAVVQVVVCEKTKVSSPASVKKVAPDTYS